MTVGTALAPVILSSTVPFVPTAPVAAALAVEAGDAALDTLLDSPAYRAVGTAVGPGPSTNEVTLVVFEAGVAVST
jgi:hypothetical protein